jgi:hypothetical protein
MLGGTMGVIIPVGFGLAKIMGTISGANKVFVSTWGYDGDVAEVPATDASEIDVILRATGRPFATANFSSQWTYLGVECIRMTATGPISGVAPQSIVGGTSTATVPINCATLLDKHTARGGRKGRGRCFLPPIWWSEANVDSLGNATSTVQSSAQALWASALTALLASDTPPVLLHSDGSTPDPITSWDVKALMATQRRRMRS